MPSRRPALALLLSAILLAALAVLAPPRPAKAMDIVSPGPLSKAHAKLEGNSLSTCEKCHEKGSAKPSGALCMESGCHAEIKLERTERSGLHGEVKLVREAKCGGCHPEHKGRDFDLVDGKNPLAHDATAWGQATGNPAATETTFDHRLVGFPLGGAHATLACEKCHTQKRPSGRPSFLTTGETKGCLATGCHTDPHGFAAGAKLASCELCHALDSWKKESPNLRFDHSATAFPLTGAHALLIGHQKEAWGACKSCHVSLTKFAPVAHGECEDCHAKADPHQGAFAGHKCAACHGTASWKKMTVSSAEHTRFAKFDTKVAHAGVACVKCHKSVSVKLGAVAEEDCTASGCHTNPHGERWMAAKAGTAEAKTCVLCHDDGHPTFKTLRVTAADHEKWSALALTGKHASVACVDPRCHQALAKVIPASKECASCHAKESEHHHRAAAFQSCQTCHGTQDWKPVDLDPATYDHVGVTRALSSGGFALTGSHKVACRSCHTDMAVKLSPACISCHAAKNPHGTGAWGAGAPPTGRPTGGGTPTEAGSPVAACSQCHGNVAWKPATFEVGAHATRFGFALTGRHAETACAGCHKALAFGPTPSDCESCHADTHHQGKFAGAPDPKTGVRHTACETCHSPDGWKKVAGDLAAGLSRPELKAKSEGCESCHGRIESFHPRGELTSCVGCHGGDGETREKDKAHVHPPSWVKRAGYAISSGNPPGVFGDLEHADPAYIRFVNPGDLRVAERSCGVCHASILKRVRTSIMATSANVPAAVLYNNGAHPSQAAVYGEAFSPGGEPAALNAEAPLSEGERKHGAVARLEPLPRWEVTAPPDSFRIFERGNDAGGARDRGTDFKIAGVYLNLVKTRLNDPALWLPGTNDSPGDYRGSGCTACHVLYANDSQPATAGPIAHYGNGGHSASSDPTIPKDEPGHPLKHQLTRSIPVSQCLTCHHHQGNGALGSYAGYIWHDQETEVDKLIAMNALPGGRGQPGLAKANDAFGELQWSDSHGHQWNFRAVYWTDREGELLDGGGSPIRPEDPEKWAKAVHLKDIHLEKGMSCVDCHGERDVHGDGFLYTAMSEASEVSCIDCHGTVAERATLLTRGAAAGPRSLKSDKTPFGQPVFYFREGRLYQRSRMQADLDWEVPQVKDVVTPGGRGYSPRAARAMTLKKDGSWGGTAGSGPLAHDPSRMECYSCHSAWNTNCYGCHLPFDANARAKEKHRGEGESRGYAWYNPQEVRADAFTLGIDGDVLGNKVSPMRSASAVVVSAKDRARQVVVEQQPTVSSSGLSGFAMTPNIPHTVRGRQTKSCSDCHPSAAGDNNSILADRLGLGTNAADWMGDYVWVAAGGEIAGVRITEGEEPRPVIGSDFHRSLHPESAGEFEKHARVLSEAETASARFAGSIAVLGEYALVADGSRGLVAYDIANVANKGVAQRVVETPTTALGQSLRVKTPAAAWVTLPASVPMIASRENGPVQVGQGHAPQGPGRRQPVMADLFRYAYLADLVEGLVVVDTQTLVDGDPTNNFLTAAARFNPGGELAGARHIALFGNYALISCRAGLAVVDLKSPTSPRLVKVLTEIRGPRAAAVQFRYAFVSDEEGVEVLDLTDPENVLPVSGARVKLKDARGLTALRDYLYVAAGREGLSVIDIHRPAEPRLLRSYDFEGALTDATGIAVGSTNASTFAYVADGRGGLKVVSLIEPSRVPGHLGFSPPPAPKLIARWSGSGAAVAVAEGQKRDRYVDESGNPISVGGRIGSRPFNLEEMKRLYLKPDGKPLLVHDEEERRGTTAER